MNKTAFATCFAFWSGFVVTPAFAESAASMNAHVDTATGVALGSEVNEKFNEEFNQRVSPLSDFVHLSQAELDSMYGQALPGPMPDGESKGEAIFFAGSKFAEPLANIAAHIWQGKIFNRADGTLLNKVFGFNLVKANVFVGKSLLDGKDAIIIDYRGGDVIFGPVRDEIREVAPGVYLGRAYWRFPQEAKFVVNFVLNFNDAN